MLAKFYSCKKWVLQDAIDLLEESRDTTIIRSTRYQ
jgi:hypothetical protein